MIIGLAIHVLPEYAYQDWRDIRFGLGVHADRADFLSVRLAL